MGGSRPKGTKGAASLEVLAWREAAPVEQQNARLRISRLAAAKRVSGPVSRFDSARPQGHPLAWRGKGR